MKGSLQTEPSFYLALKLFGNKLGLLHLLHLTLHGGVDEQQAMQADARGEDLVCYLKTQQEYFLL